MTTLSKKVSVLMNCYNCEKYLRESIESVFNQTYKDWEIIFIDNCSTDRSAVIAKSYGDKVKYYKTHDNISLGAARVFGTQFCSNYIATLDTDDIWLPNALEDLYGAITSGNFALAYGNQISIDKSGNIIGKHRSKYSGKKGNLFPDLLIQFDIPMVATMISKPKMIESGLNFDGDISGSVEYSLFMPLAIKNNIISIDKYIVKYRVHDSLSSKLGERKHKERELILNKILLNDPSLRKKYSREFDLAYARGKYYEAQFLMSEGCKHTARRVLKEIMFKDIRYFALTILTLLPILIWNLVQRFKYKR